PRPPRPPARHPEVRLPGCRPGALRPARGVPGGHPAHHKHISTAHPDRGGPLLRTGAHTMSTKICCTTSVGVLILSEDRRKLLMIERNTPPAGIAPVAGHALDEHPSYQAAAEADVAEEIGLTVVDLTESAVGGFHPGRCRRTGSSGHVWELSETTLTGQINASTREVAAVGWSDLDQIQYLAERTADHAAGLLDAAEFAARPGLEPVWCQWMWELGHVDLSTQELDDIKHLAATPPALHL